MEIKYIKKKKSGNCKIWEYAPSSSVFDPLLCAHIAVILLLLFNHSKQDLIFPILPLLTHLSQMSPGSLLPSAYFLPPTGATSCRFSLCIPNKLPNRKTSLTWLWYQSHVAFEKKLRGFHLVVLWVLEVKANLKLKVKLWLEWEEISEKRRGNNLCLEPTTVWKASL